MSDRTDQPGDNRRRSTSTSRFDVPNASEAIYPQAFAVHPEPDGARDLLSATPGPAGTAELPLSDDVTVIVDYAHPEQLVALQCPVDPSVSQLGALIGVRRVERLETLKHLPDNSGRVRRLNGRTAASQRGFNTAQSLPQNGEAAQLIGRAAVLFTDLLDDQRPDLARLAAGVEFLNLLPSLIDLTPRQAPTDETVLMEIAALVDDRRSWGGDLEELVENDPQTASELAEQCRQVRNPNKALRLLAQQIDTLLAPNRESDAFNQSAVSLRMSAPLPRYAHAALIDDMISDSVLHVVREPVELRSGGRLVIHTDARHRDHWARVLHVPSGILLAVVPVIGGRREWTAEAIIPPSLARHEIDVDLTLSPLPRDNTVAATQAAVLIGREATRHAAAGETGRAQELWLQCERAWELLGDVTRAALARQEQQRTRRSAVTRSATLADRISVTLGND